MVALHRRPLKTLERWTPTLFLAGGAGVVTHAALVAMQAFTNLATPPDVFAPAGHLLAFLGLLGLYPAVAARSPRLARVAGAVGTVAVGSWLVMTVGQLLVAAGPWGSLPALLPRAFFGFVLGASVLAYALFGMGARRAGASRSVWHLVAAPGVLLGVVVVGPAVAVPPATWVVVSAALAGSILALGYRLRTWEARQPRGAPVGSPAPG